MLKAGAMQTPVTLQRQSSTQDAAGQPVLTWTDIGNRICAIEPLNGREFFAASGENSRVNVRIRMRYDPTVRTVRPYDRIVDKTRSPNVAYDIEAVVNDRERDREVIFMCMRNG